MSSRRMRVVDFTPPFMITHLAAIMKTKHATTLDIHSVSDLARQSTVKYGTIVGGWTFDFFRTSRTPLYERMWAEMTRDANDRFPSTVEEGFHRVITSTDQHPYAFIFGSPELTYIASLRCDMQVVMDEHIFQYYSMAMPLNYQLHAHLSLGILEMHDSGELNRLRRRWWPEPQCGHGTVSFPSSCLLISFFIITAILHLFATDS